MYVSGPPSTPLKPFGEQTYYTASLYGAIGILLALRRRAQNGRGAHLDISLQEAAASTMGQVMVRYFYEKVVVPRQGNLQGDGDFCILPCKDGHILLSPFHHWETLVGWMESEGMAGDLKDEKYGQEEFRRRHFDHIHDLLEWWTRIHTVEELFSLGQLMHFPFAPVHSPRQAMESPQLKARNFFTRVRHPEMGASLPYPSGPSRYFSSSEWKRAPLLGEDNERIYRELLNLSGEDLKRLAALSAI